MPPTRHRSLVNPGRPHLPHAEVGAAVIGALPGGLEGPNPDRPRIEASTTLRKGRKSRKIGFRGRKGAFDPVHIEHRRRLLTEPDPSEG